MERIEFNRPAMTGLEHDVLEDVLSRGHFSGDGHYTKLCSAELARITGAERVLLTPSCTAALEMAVILARVGVGDEVILPSFTFASVANAIALRGAVPVFVDVHADTLNIDAERISAALTERTKAIIVVHYAGVSCDMNALRALAAKHGIILIEDAAHAVGATYGDKPLGGIGDLGTFSFHDTKNLSCGEGGALLINDPRLVEHAEIVREKGTNRSRFLRGEVDKYTWVELGSSYLLSELNAGFLWAQIQQCDAITERRVSRWERYHAAFAELEGSGQARRPKVPVETQHNGHIYYLLLGDSEKRERVRRELGNLGIVATSHYELLHASPAGKRHGRVLGALINSERIAATILRLPMHDSLTRAQQDRVIGAVYEVLAVDTITASH